MRSSRAINTPAAIRTCSGFIFMASFDCSKYLTRPAVLWGIMPFSLRDIVTPIILRFNAFKTFYQMSILRRLVSLMIKWSMECKGGTRDYHTTMRIDGIKTKFYLSVGGKDYFDDYRLKKASVKNNIVSLDFIGKENGNLELMYTVNGKQCSIGSEKAVEILDDISEAVKYMENLTPLDNILYFISCGGIKSEKDFNRRLKNIDKEQSLSDLEKYRNILLS